MMTSTAIDLSILEGAPSLRQAVSGMLRAAVRAYARDVGGAGCMITVGVSTFADEHQALADERRT
jgi:hypothetical protein